MGRNILLLMRLIKTLLLFIFIGVLSETLNAQTPKPSGFPITTSNGWIRYGWLQSDSGSIAAVRDTNFSPRFAGTTVYWQHAGVDTALWVFNGKATGKRWDKVGSGSSISGSYVPLGDSGVIYVTPKQFKDTLATQTLQTITNKGATTTNKISIGSPILSANSTLGWAAGYQVINSGSTNLSTNQNFYLINNAHNSRIRQTGTVTQIQIYLNSLPGSLTAFYFDVWRKNGATWDSVAHVNIYSLLTSGINTITLPRSVNVNVGDYTGLSYTCSSAPSNFLNSTASTGGAYYKTSAPTWTAHDWTADNVLTTYVPIFVYMQSPVISFIGDSHVSGYPYNSSYIEQSMLDSTSASYPYKVGAALGITYQNLGLAGETTTTINSNFKYVLTDANPRYGSIDAGINDVGSAFPISTTIGNIKKMLDSAVLHNIVPLVHMILPWNSSGTSGGRKIDSINYQIDSMVTASYPTARIIDCRTTIGQFRVGGDPGNLWDINPVYGYGDGLHFNGAGNAVIANKVVDAISQTTYGNDIQRNGQTYSFPSSSGTLALEGVYPTLQQTTTQGATTSDAVTFSNKIRVGGSTAPSYQVDVTGEIAATGRIIAGGGAIDGSPLQANGDIRLTGYLNGLQGLYGNDYSTYSAQLVPSFGVRGWQFYTPNATHTAALERFNLGGSNNLSDTAKSYFINTILGIGTTTPAASSIVDVSSTVKGVLLPRMTTAQRTAIPSPDEGLEVYDLTLHKKYVFDGTIWQACW
jgi:lysophospholipase L1-like esterase